MKRFSKILVAVLALCLLVGALALAISANTGVEGNFVVQGTGYATWEEAVAAANNTHTIYINENWELETGITLSGETTNVKVNLNGKTVSTKDGSMLFNVHTNAKLTIEGEGTINNAGAVAIGASSSGVVTINATGSGIVINNNTTSGDVNTFRFQQYATLNVSGKIVVNTNAVTASRALFNIADSGKRTVKLNITDADISYAKPSVTGAPAAKLIYSQFSDIDINNSKLEVIYGYMFYSSTTGNVTVANGGSVGDYIEQYKKEGSDTTYFRWNAEKKADAAKDISISITENITVNNSKLYSRLDEYAGRLDGNFMSASGATKADFTNSIIVTYGRAFNGDSRKCLGADSSSVIKTDSNPTQISLYDCHVMNSGDKLSGGNTYLFCYGPVFRILGGSVSGFGNLATAQTHYLELVDAGGNPTGQWLGGYVDNVLGISGLNPEAEVSTQWQQPTAYNPASTIVGTLPSKVTITIDGAEKSFTTGYFSDEAKYNAYFATEDVLPSWRDYLVGSADGSNITATGDYINDNGTATAGTYPFDATGGNGQNKGVMSSVLGTNKKGEPNGYVKFHLDANTSGTNSTSSKYTYFKTITGAGGSIITTDAYVFEFDVSTDTGVYPAVSMTFQGREKMPRYDASGKYLGFSNTDLQIDAMDYTPSSTVSIGTSPVISYNGKSAALPTTSGDWARITLIVDFEDTGILEEIEVPVYAKNGNKNASDKEVFDRVADTTVKVKATKLTKYEIHMYVDGVYVSTNAYDVTTIGYDGYIPEGTEGNFYIDGLRISHRGYANKDESYCFDNIRISQYTDAQSVDLGFLDENGKPVASIKGLSHFLVMPDNMAEAPAATVDGVDYFSEAEAIAAIKEGSTLKLYKNFESLINANVSFKLEPNGFTFPGFVSATHTPVDYVGSFGYIKLVEASETEIYTVNYTFNGITKTQTVAKGTVIPAMEEEFDAIIEGNLITFVTGWTLPVNVPTDFNFTGNVINATYTSDTKEISIMAGGVGYENLADAIAGANGATITLYADITVDEMIYVDGITAKIDLNGKTITAGENATTIFNVRQGSNFTITGKGTINNVSNFISSSNLGVANTTVNVEADGATTGIVINHRAIEDDTAYIHTFRCHDESILNVSGLITVNAYNGVRAVFNVYAGSGTKGAKALNISKAKVYVPLLTKDFGDEANMATPGYSQVINAGDNIAITIVDSELRAEYGQLFKINGASDNKTVADYKNTVAQVTAEDGKTVITPADFTWKDGAEKNVKIDAATSTIVAENSYFYSSYMKFSKVMNASGHNPGASFMALQAKLDAKFDNCIIQADWRGITSNVTIATNKINQHQLTFTDCDFLAVPGDTNGTAQFFIYGVNYKIIGGTWARGNISAGTHYYLPLEDANGNLTGQWVGGYMDGTLVNSAKTFFRDSGVTGGWVDSTYTEDDSLISCSIKRVINGTSYTFTAAYFADKAEYAEVYKDYVAEAKAYNLFKVYMNTGDEDPAFPSFSAGNVNGTVTKTGGYVKHYFDGKASIKNYNNLDGNPGSISYATTGAYIWEFDVSTDHGYFATTDINIEARDRHAVFGEDGSYLGYANAAGALNSLNYEATWSLNIAGDTAKFNGKSVKISTEKGDWTRITFVLDIVYGEERTETVPVYVNNGRYVENANGTKTYYVDVVEGKTHDIQVVDITGTTMSVYIDGVLLSSYNPVTTSDFFGGALAKDYMANGYVDDLRIKNSATKESSICYDNILFMSYTHENDAMLGIVGEDGKVVDSLIGNPFFLSMPGKTFTPAPVINVDGVGYASVADANAAIKEGSVVELLTDIDEAIEINYKNVKFINNGHSCKGFVSSAYKFVDYSAARGASYSFLADASEIVTITYPEFNGVSGTQTAVIGSLLKAPAEYNAASKKFNDETKKYDLLAGWTLVEGEDVQIITAAGVAYPVITEVDAVIVNWTDAEGNVLDTDYYFPGDKTVLDAFDGEDIAVDHSADYYGIGRSGWAGIEDATAGLATSGVYNITAVMGKVAPDYFPGLKYNLSLYANYVVNFYVPQEIEGISNAVISEFADGSASISKFEPGTIEGVPYDKFGYMLGIADTEIKTFYLVYNVGEDRIAFPVSVGVPSYAAIVMDMYDEDTSNKGEATKALIVNMANYATKVLALDDEFDMNAPGAKIYSAIVEAYGEKYLSYYAGLTDERFLAGEAGDLYKSHGVAALNWITGTDEKAGNAEALTYIESIGFNFNTFEPAFLIKFSDAAVAKGLQIPDGSGWSGYYTAGLNVYAGCYSPYCTKQWAEKDGKTYGRETDIWATKGEADKEIISKNDTSYDYYAMAANRVWDTVGANAGRQEWYKVDHIRNDLKINVLWSYYDSTIPEGSNKGWVTTTIGTVNYNLAAYINDMLTSENAAENAEFIEAAKALYAYSYVSAKYGSTK